MNFQISGRCLRFRLVEPWQTLADARGLLNDYANSHAALGGSSEMFLQNADRQTRGRTAFEDRPVVEERAFEQMRSLRNRLRTFFIQCAYSDLEKTIPENSIEGKRKSSEK